MRRHSIGGITTRSQGKGAATSSTEESVEESVSASEPNMVVAVRVRPLSDEEKSRGLKSCCSVLNGKVMASINDYGFDSVLDENCTQKQVYEATTKRFISRVISGLNVTVFAYGATGAGKTHTMLGDTRADASAAGAEAGVIPQATPSLALGEHYRVITSFVEIYNEQVYDLLEPSSKVLQLREDQDRGIVQCAGCTEVQVASAKQVLDLLAQGNRRRKTEATMANVVSSRSHAVLQLTLQHIQRTDSGREQTTDSKLSLIDLAGSERASATNNRGARLQEGANINRSLLALANCINALASNSSGRKMNVKYRDSRLTHLLKASLEGGNCCLVMIANVNPSHTTFEDSHNTLKYANRAKNIKVNPQAQVQAIEERVLELELLVDELRSQVARSDYQQQLVAPSAAAAVSNENLENACLPSDYELKAGLFSSSTAETKEKMEEGNQHPDEVVMQLPRDGVVANEFPSLDVEANEIVEDPQVTDEVVVYSVDMSDLSASSGSVENREKMGDDVTVATPAPAPRPSESAPVKAPNNVTTAAPSKKLPAASKHDVVAASSVPSRPAVHAEVANPFMQVLSSATKPDRKRPAADAEPVRQSNSGATHSSILDNKRRRTSEAPAIAPPPAQTQGALKLSDLQTETAVQDHLSNKPKPRASIANRKIRRRSLNIKNLPEDHNAEGNSLQIEEEQRAAPVIKTKPTPVAAEKAPILDSVPNTASQDQENRDPQVPENETMIGIDSKTKPIFRPPTDTGKARRRSLGGVEGSLAAVSAMLVDLGATSGLIQRNKAGLKQKDKQGEQLANKNRTIAVVPVEESTDRSDVWIDI
eukprot:GSChrysophyteH1.ASY1.ANO1.3290.1 assembled CDS